MRNAIARWKAIVLCSVMFCLPEVVLAEQGTSCDSVRTHPDMLKTFCAEKVIQDIRNLRKTWEVPEYTSRIVSSIVWG